MTHYPPDVLYAYAQIGLDPGAPYERIQKALEDAIAYRFATPARIEQVRRFGHYFNERAALGTVIDSFARVRKYYHHQAMALHPDRNRGDKKAEEHLKALNAAYELVEEIHREAQDYARQPEHIREETEAEARQAVMREAEAAAKNAPQESKNEKPQEKPAASVKTSEAVPNSVKYMAASVPRYIRTSRLFYLTTDTIIGSWNMGTDGNIGMVYDVIMLPEVDFRRARLRLGIEGHGIEELSMTKLTPPYIPADIKEIAVPPWEPDPRAYAKAYFQKEFKLLP